jgi:hypothetical protein
MWNYGHAIRLSNECISNLAAYLNLIFSALLPVSRDVYGVPRCIFDFSSRLRIAVQMWLGGPRGICIYYLDVMHADTTTPRPINHTEVYVQLVCTCDWWRSMGELGWKLEAVA